LPPSGVGKGSTGIGVEIFKALLPGDAHVVVTTSCCSQATPEYDQGIFRVLVAAAVLLLLSSFSSRQDYKQDIEPLVDFIYTDAGLDFDYNLQCPLVAVPENGSRSESIVKQQT
jgi:3-oxoacyl-ACP reductase-like protein